MENNKGRYILILELKSIIGKYDYLPVRLNDLGEIADEDLRFIKIQLLRRWKYDDPPILKRGSFIQRLRKDIVRSQVYCIPWEISLEYLLTYWIDYYYIVDNDLQVVPSDIMKIFINSKPIEKLWQYF